MVLRQRREQELENEIQAHLDLAVRDRVEQGESPRTADLAVRREFGNRTLVEQVTREMGAGARSTRCGRTFGTPSA